MNLPDWGNLGQALDPLATLLIGIVSVLVLRQQIRSSERAVIDSNKQATNDRVTETLRLVRDWLEPEHARNQRRGLFNAHFINPDGIAGSQPLEPFRAQVRLNTTDTQMAIENVVAQFDAV